MRLIRNCEQGLIVTDYFSENSVLVICTQSFSSPTTNLYVAIVNPDTFSLVLTQLLRWSLDDVNNFLKIRIRTGRLRVALALLEVRNRRNMDRPTEIV